MHGNTQNSFAFHYYLHNLNTLQEEVQNNVQ